MQRYILLLFCTLLISSCTAPATPAPINWAAMYIPKPGITQQVPSAPIVLPPTATSLPNAETIPTAIWVPPYLSETMGSALEEPLRGLFVSDPAQANIRLEVGTGNPVSQWIYALVTPFSSTLQGVSGEELLSIWQGGSTSGLPLLMDQNTYDMFTALWGPAGASVQVLNKAEIVDHAWSNQPALAIVPFEDLQPRWKVLAVDGISPIHRNADLTNYRLKIPISLNSDPDRAALIQSNFSIPASNLDPQKMTTVVVTGVTALVRATAYTMERRGMLYPAQDIRGLLLDADITHISNEVPFAVDCPDPNPNQQSMRFCSRDEYIQLLEDVGTDVVELTGDHFQDWGTDAMVPHA